MKPRTASMSMRQQQNGPSPSGPNSWPSYRYWTLSLAEPASLHCARPPPCPELGRFGGSMGKRVTPGKKQRAGDGVPRHDTPPRPITPPSNHRHDVLPLTDVGSVAFEKVCRDVVSYAYPAIVSAA